MNNTHNTRERMAGTRVRGPLLEQMEREAQERRWTLAEIVRAALEDRYGAPPPTNAPSQQEAAS